MSPKSLVITGASRGIGRALATHFAGEGAHVAILDIDASQGRKVAARLGKKAVFVPCDLADPAQIHAAALALKGFPKLDGLINNAGIGAFKPLEALTTGEWDRVLNVNLRAAFLCVREFLPRMKDGASVLNIASTRALMSEPGGEAYGASKGGLLALTHAMALSLQKRRIRVNAVLPGWIDVSAWQGGGMALKLRKLDHAQHPAGRVGRPEDVAEAAAYLMDAKRSGFVTGQQLVVDGGMTVKMIYHD
jgi:NAD(P)-dependent dehydrogenase (short-subunit alcohol dehydrogenase family)